jgi:hypothetical protein
MGVQNDDKLNIVDEKLGKIRSEEVNAISWL